LPRWSPDGKFLAFVAGSRKGWPAGRTPTLYAAMAGGDSFQFTTTRAEQVATVVTRRQMIAFVNSANPEDLAKQAARKSRRPRRRESQLKQRKKSHTRATSRDHARGLSRKRAGYLDTKHPTHLGHQCTRMGTISDAEATHSGRYDDANVTWAKDSSQIYSIRSFG